MRYVKLAIITLIALVLQTTIFNIIPIFGVIPNILVVLVICYAVNEKSIITSAIYGVICGVLLDSAGGMAFGTNALLCMYAAILCTYMSKRFFKGKFIVSLLFVICVSLIYELAFYFLCIGMWNRSGIVDSVLWVVLPTVFYNIILSVFVLPVTAKVCCEQ